MTYDEIKALMALIQRWRNGYNDRQDGEAAAARKNCADEIESFVKERESIKWNALKSNKP